LAQSKVSVGRQKWVEIKLVLTQGNDEITTWLDKKHDEIIGYW